MDTVDLPSAVPVIYCRAVEIRMDNVTHTLFALTLARTRLGRTGRGATTALVLASNAPDIDIVTALGGSASYLTWHRGPTHGPLGILALGFLTAVCVWGVGRFVAGARAPDDARRGPRASFATLFLLGLVGVTGHILMDLPTSYGTRLLSPFSWHWFAADWMPIIDIYLLMALAAGLVFGRLSSQARRLNVAIVLVIMAANYGVRAVAHQEALMLAPRLFGPTLPSRCDPGASSEWLLDSWPQLPPSLPTSGKRCLVEVAAVPTFLSPFRWRVIAHVSDAYEVQDLNLLDGRFRTPAPPSEVLWRLTRHWPNQWTPAIAASATARTAQVFLGFSRFPSVRSSVDPDWRDDGPLDRRAV